MKHPKPQRSVEAVREDIIITALFVLDVVLLMILLIVIIGAGIGGCKC